MKIQIALIGLGLLVSVVPVMAANNSKVYGTPDDLQNMRIGPYKIGSSVADFYPNHPEGKKRKIGSKFTLAGEQFKSGGTAQQFSKMYSGRRLCQSMGYEKVIAQEYDRAFYVDRYFDKGIASGWVGPKNIDYIRKVMWYQPLSYRLDDVGKNARLFVYGDKVVGFELRNEIVGVSPEDLVKQVEAKFGKPVDSKTYTSFYSYQADRRHEEVTVLSYHAVFPDLFKAPKYPDQVGDTGVRLLSAVTWEPYLHTFAHDVSHFNPTGVVTTASDGEIFSVMVSSRDGASGSQPESWRAYLHIFALVDYPAIAKAQSASMNDCATAMYMDVQQKHKDFVAKKAADNAF